MDIEQVAHIVALVERSQLYEVTIVDGSQSVRVVNNLDQRDITDSVDIGSLTKAQTAPNEASHDKEIQVIAPYVGRVYLNEDGAMDNLISKGKQVEKGQTVCFIDELSRLLPVVSDKSGTVNDILVANGDSVEYGQPIFNLKI